MHPFYRLVGEAAVAAGKRMRDFLRAHVLVFLGMLLALFAYYCVLVPPPA